MKRRGQSRGRAGRAWKCFGRSGPPRFPARPKGVGSRPRRLAESRETTDEGTPSSRSTLDRRGRHAGSPGFALKYQYPRSIRREGARLGCAPISSSMLPPDMLRRETRTGAFPARRARVRSAVRADMCLRAVCSGTRTRTAGRLPLRIHGESPITISSTASLRRRECGCPCETIRRKMTKRRTRRRNARRV